MASRSNGYPSHERSGIDELRRLSGESGFFEPTIKALPFGCLFLPVDYFRNAPIH